MNNRIPLIILSVLSVAMLIVIMILLLWPDRIVEVSQDTYLIEDRSSIERVDYHFPDGTSFAIQAEDSSDSEKHYLLSFEEGTFDTNWTDQDRLKQIFVTPTTLSYSQIIAGASDYNQYGLMAPVALIDIHFEDDGLVSLKIGGQSTHGNLQYLQIDGEEEVYVIDSASLGFIYLGERSLISSSVLSSDYSSVQTVSISRRSDDLTVSFDATHSTGSNGMMSRSWQMTEPITISPGSLSMNVLQFLLSFPVERYLPIDTDISDTGLDNPEYTISIVDTDGRIRTVYLSHRSEGGYVGYADDFIYPFHISLESIGNLRAESVSFFPLYLLEIQASELSAMDFNSDFFAYRLDVDILDSETVDSDRARASLNYVNLKTSTDDGRVKFDVVFAAIQNVRISGYEPDASPNADISTYLTLTLRDRTQINYSFSPKNDRELYLFIEGAYSGLIVNAGTLLHSDSNVFSENSLEGAMNYVLGSS